MEAKEMDGPVVVEGESEASVGGLSKRTAKQKELSKRRKEKGTKKQTKTTGETIDISAVGKFDPLPSPPSHEAQRTSSDHQQVEADRGQSAPIDDGETRVIPWAHSEQPPMTQKAVVVYCEVCGLPPSYCEFFPGAEACLSSRQAASTACTVSPQSGVAEPTDASAPAAAGDAQLPPAEKRPTAPGGAQPSDLRSDKKEKKAPPPRVTIQRVTRSKRKVTIIVGLELFAVNLDAAAKIFKKQFACGSSVSKGIPGKPDHVEIQGNAAGNLIDVLLKNFPDIPEESIHVLPPK